MTPRLEERVDGVQLAWRRAMAALVMAGLLSGCALPERPAGPSLYDLGPGSSGPLGPARAASAAGLPALAVSVQASPALDGTAMLYRLAYADAGRLHAYAHARWAMSPAELVRQRLREVLSQQRVVLNPGEGAPRALQLELEEFSQVFAAPDQSAGLLRLRATAWKRTPGGDMPVAQHSMVVQRPAASADAAGGVRALNAATDAAVAELAQWLGQLP